MSVESTDGPMAQCPTHGWYSLHTGCFDCQPTPARHHDQSRLDSLAEALTNTAIGFVISMVTWHFVARGFGIPMPIGENLMITGIFTVVSIVRQYVLRRAFDGRSVWRVIRGHR